ncbi:MAG TPA: alpha-ketoglutarate-dependent dioxygenase AlkB [Polyangiaceae bacterium]
MTNARSLDGDASPAQVQLTPKSFYLLYRNWLAPESARALAAAARDGLDWQQRHIVLFGRKILQPRLVAWAGEVPYRYSGQTLEPRKVPSFVRDLLAAAGAAAACSFNHVLMNRYRDENDAMGMHSDDEAELGPRPSVASLSLGAERRLMIVSKRRSLGVRHELLLEHNSLLVMGGAFQHELRHGVPRERRARAERLNFTFRRVVVK